MIYLFARLLAHPVAVIFGQILITAYAIVCTRPSSYFRLALLSYQVLALWLIFENCMRTIPAMWVASVIAGNAPTYFLRYLDLVLLRRWDSAANRPTTSVYNEYGPVTRKPSEDAPRGGTLVDQNRSHNLSTQLRSGVNMTISARLVNTPYEVKNVPHFTEADSGRVPSQREFLSDSLKKAALCYFVIDLVTFSGPPEDSSTSFAPSKVPFFSRFTELSAEEFALRIVTTAILWLTVFCVLRMYYGLLASITVWLGWYEVHDWRPPFGSMSDAWSIRQFWG